MNVTLDGVCDHRAIPTDEELHRHAIENLDQTDAVLLGRVTYEMMEGFGRLRGQERGLIGWNLRPDDRRGKEVRRVEHPGPGRLERGARARRSREGRSSGSKVRDCSWEA